MATVEEALVNLRADVDWKARTGYARQRVDQISDIRTLVAALDGCPNDGATTPWYVRAGLATNWYAAYQEAAADRDAILEAFGTDNSSDVIAAANIDPSTIRDVTPPKDAA